MLNPIPADAQPTVVTITVKVNKKVKLKWQDQKPNFLPEMQMTQAEAPRRHQGINN